MDDAGKGYSIRRVVLLGSVIAFSFGILPYASMSAEDVRVAKSHSLHTVEKESTAGSDAAVIKKLNEILANQQTILANQQTIFQRFDAMKEELRIIKVRASIH